MFFDKVPQQNTAKFFGNVANAPTSTASNQQSQVTNPLGKAIVGFGNVAQQTNAALTGNMASVPGVNQTAAKIFDYANPIGWAAKGLGALTSGLGWLVNKASDYTSKPMAAYLGNQLRQAVGPQNVDKVMNAPLTQSLIKEYTTDPDIAAGLGAVNSVAGLMGTLTLTKGGVEGLGDLSTAAADYKLPFQKAPSPTDVTGRITQATNPTELASAQRGLTSVDMSKVKTYDQGVKVLNDAIKTNSTQVDTALSGSTEMLSPEDTQTEIPVKGGEPIVSNPVLDGLKQLEDFYKKTNDSSNLARIKNLQAQFDSTGLSPKEINDIAREHGNVLNAYNQNGELASGLTRQAAENTRTGMKETVRGQMPDDTTRATDKNTSDLIKTRDLFKEMGEKVQAVENKIKSSGILGKIGRGVGNVIDFTSGGFLRGMLRALQGFSGGGSSLNALDLQNALLKNLNLLDRLSTMTSDELENQFSMPQSQNQSTAATPPPTTPAR